MFDDFEQTITIIDKLYESLGIFLLDLSLEANYEVLYKSDGSPVSELDLLINDYVESYIHHNLSDFQLISEEKFQNCEIVSDNLVVLDPLDGTENFVSGIPIWGVGIAVYLKSKLFSGVVYFPEIRKFECSKNTKIGKLKGYQRMSKPLHTTRISGYSSNHGDLTLKNTSDSESRIYGSALFNLVLTANKAITYVPSPYGSWIWDIAPGLIMCLERGFTVYVDGQIYDGKILNPCERHFIEIR
jgi:myo-inositol-1(or 4)-monophosphatase